MTGTGWPEEDADEGLRELADKVFAAADANAGASGLDESLWSTLEAVGLARVSAPETVGGSGGSVLDSVVVLRAAGATSARVPVAETDVLAAWLCAVAGIDPPEGPLTAVAGPDARRSRGGAAVTVPWWRSVAGVVVLGADEIVLLDPSSVHAEQKVNLAGEPRDVVDLAAARVLAAVEVGAEAGSELAEEFVLRAAFARAALLSGAIGAAVDASVQYAGERVQFGRPLGRFQAVQQSLALAAGEAVAAYASVRSAARVVMEEGFGKERAQWEIAVAKSRCSEAAGVVARIAHQVHGAIGFTQEHHLHLLTTRLWAWRDEDGSEDQWHARLAERALGPGTLWHAVTGAGSA